MMYYLSVHRTYVLCRVQSPHRLLQLHLKGQGDLMQHLLRSFHCPYWQASHIRADNICETQVLQLLLLFMENHARIRNDACACA